MAAGRTAANLLDGFSSQRSGLVGVVMGSRSLRDHADWLFGFRQVMEVEHLRLDLLTPLVGHCSIGAGNRRILAALQSAGAADRVIWVCHELTSHARRALLEGAAMPSSTRTRRMKCAPPAGWRWLNSRGSACCLSRSASASKST